MNQSGRFRQRGMSLLTVLLLLLIMTLLGLASLRSVIMQERMSSNMLDRSVGFQVAESALREAETMLIGTPRPLFDGSVVGLYPPPADNAIPRWLDPATVWRAGTEPDATSQLSPGAPQFIIESLGSGPLTRNCQKVMSNSSTCEAERFRITARSQAGNRAQVTTQSIFALPSP